MNRKGGGKQNGKIRMKGRNEEDEKEREKKTKGRNTVCIAQDARFYHRQIARQTSAEGIKANEHVKKVHSNRLGKNKVPDTAPYTTTTEHVYYKEDSKLTFDIVRSPQQIERWNRITVTTFRRQFHSAINYGYNRALQLYQFAQNHRPIIVEDLTHRVNILNGRYIIPAKSRLLLNKPDVYLRRTPPPDNGSHTPIHDSSHVPYRIPHERSGMFTSPPPTPARR
ncbi:hypothetical protein RhiirA5_424258 [Rhizophagus irregularis]|uniref:Uncharacterized protein n=1 Tax=Rhizophagus irregularis TaxID=588596 RepID=A0A2N0QTQ2_9GLOM|nr:hypothetical protein RhiirA5_424258 [Rhizophagus irregularis]PKC54452.1 hypothetical protein RhiirA1_477288 [Rhizophagus irregularis]